MKLSQIYLPSENWATYLYYKERSGSMASK